MHHDFDRLIDRKATNSLSEDGYPSYLFGDAGVPPTRFDRSQLISMWVADMQFAAPQVVIDAMAERLQHPVFGYTMNLDDGLHDAFRDWCLDRYGWSFTREETQVSLGVIPALFGLVDYICAPDDKVLTLTPAYHYFEHAAVKRGRRLVTCDLVYQDGDCLIDFDDFERKVSDPAVKLFFLCHPHNPTGRVWTDAELRRLGEICFAHGVRIVSDEIHCDLLRQGQRHTPLAKLFPGSKNIVTCMAISKTFNLAGLMIATVMIPDEELRAVWKRLHFQFVNPLSLAAAAAAYRHGGPWLEDLRAYLDGNFALVDRFLRDHLPDTGFQVPAATYLAWIDLSRYMPDTVPLTRFFFEHSGVILLGGERFVTNGRQRIRLNLGCPRSRLEEGLMRIGDAIKTIKA